MEKLSFEKLIFDKNTPLPGSFPRPIIYSLSVKHKFNNYNIVDFFCENVPSVPQSKWVDKIKNGNLTVNEKPTTTHYKVKTGDRTKHSTPPVAEPNISIDIQLIYEDRELIVLNKPAPLPMHTCGRFHKNTLNEILRATFPEKKLKIIHRLDSNTTGLVVLGKNKDATAFIAKQFELHQVEKRYLALVEGVVNTPSFESNSAISTFTTASGSRKIDPNGTNAFTAFNVLEKRDITSLLEILPKSGKTNQIRLHLAEIGHPIVGDLGYKTPSYFEENPLTYSEDILCLHAWKLSFKHPKTNKIVHFEAPIPDKFSR